ncbi:MAG: hypothetical protein AAGJ83_16410 [Planctomycetota bacterium]
MRLVILAIPALFLIGCKRQPEPEAKPTMVPDVSLNSIIEAVSDDSEGFRGLKFRNIVAASTNRVILPVETGDPASDRIVQSIGEALEETLEEFNQPNSPTNDERRINEVSSHFEDRLREKLDAVSELSCDFPRNERGDIQRAGYPDLRIVHEPTGRIAYLDPKLVGEGSLNSTFRTFYFTPKGETSKIDANAHHLLVGIEHDGNTGDWKFVSWTLVDLYGLNVRLKAEFQAGNQAIYATENVIGTSK